MIAPSGYRNLREQLPSSSNGEKTEVLSEEIFLAAFAGRAVRRKENVYLRNLALCFVFLRLQFVSVGQSYL